MQLFAPLEEFERVLSDPSVPHTLYAARQRGCFVTDDDAIGPYVRWLVALRVLAQLIRRQQAGTGAKQVSDKALLAELTRTLKQGERTNVEKQFRLRFGQTRPLSTPQQYLHGVPFEQLLIRLNERLRKTRHKPIRWEDLLSVETRVNEAGMPTPKCLERFEQWVVHGFYPPLDHMATLQPETLLYDPDDARDRRNAQIRAIERAIAGGDDTRPIVCLHSRDDTAGLRACATELLLRERSRELRSGKALIYVRLSGTGTAQSLPNARDVIKFLNGIFGIQPEQVLEVADVPIDWAHDLRALRQAFTLLPCLVVFDGVPNAYGPLSPLLDLIRDVHIDEMLRVVSVGDAQTMRDHGGNFSSRFVVLSAEAMPSLKEWTARSYKLRPPSKQFSLWAYLRNPEAYVERTALATRVLGTRSSAISLKATYGLTDAHLDTLQALCGKAHYPGESALAIVGLLQQNKLPTWKSNFDARPHADSDWRVHLLSHRLDELRRSDPVGVLAINFIAASVSGMRLSTLRRAVRQFMELLPNDPPTSDPKARPLAEDRRRLGYGLERFLSTTDFLSGSTLATRYHSLIVEGIEEDFEGVESTKRRFELQRLPSDPDEPGEGAASARFFEVRHEEIRALLVARMIANARSGDQPPTMLGLEWRAINWILSEESLTQSTVMQRAAETRASPQPYTHRRAVQAIWHGLLSHPYEAALRRDDVPWNVPAEFALPIEPLKRFRFLYTFIYRRQLEQAPRWLLLRGFARPRLKLALLSFFASPAWAVQALLAAPRAVAYTSPAKGSEAIDYPFNDASLVSSRTWIYRDAAIYLEIVEGIARAALDSGQTRLMHRALQIARGELDDPQQELFAASSGEVANDQGAAYRGIYGKLLIDAALADNRTSEALSASLAELQTFGVSADLIAELHEAADAAWRMDLKNDLKKVLDRTLDAVSARLLRRRWSSGQRIKLADLLFRFGELRSIHADKVVEDRVSPVPYFLQSYAVYFVADRVRSGPNDYGDSLDWPLASSRSMRYYVRTALVLAKLLPADSQDVRLQFFIHARVRIDVLSRHMQQLPRERVALLLLRAAAARIWSGLTAGADQQQALETSLAYVDEAESAAFSLGYSHPMIHRLVFERIKTLRKLTERAGAATASYARLIERDRATLTRLSSYNEFWRELVERFLKRSALDVR